MRFAFPVCLLFVVAVVAAEACARGDDGGSVVARQLLEKGMRFLRQAEAAHRAGDRADASRYGKQAERLFFDALAQDPRNRAAALLGGQAATFAGDLKSAVGWVDRYFRLSPGKESDPELHYLRAFVHLIGYKRADRAVRSLTRMYSLNARVRPEERDNLWFMAVTELGRSYLEADKVDEAIRQFRTGMHLARRRGNVMRETLMQGNIGVALMRDERFIEAEEIFGALRKKQKDEPIWHWQLALTLANQTKFAEAIEVYKEVVRLREKGLARGQVAEQVSLVHLRIGNCLRHVGEGKRNEKTRQRLFEEARKHLKLFIKESPKNPLGHKWMGVLLFQNMEKPHDALPFFQRAFALDWVCEDSLRRMIAIVETFPPPEGMTKEAWRAPLAGWRKDLEDRREARKKIKKERKKKDGSEGCI